MKYNLIKLIRNTSDQYVAQTETYDTLTAAKIGYHNTCAALHNADDCKLAVVFLVDEFGHSVESFRETIDHRPVEALEE